MINDDDDTKMILVNKFTQTQFGEQNCYAKTASIATICVKDTNLQNMCEITDPIHISVNNLQKFTLYLGNFVQFL